MRFGDFRAKHGNKDLGLQQAAAATLREFRKQYDNFPGNVTSEEDQFDYIFYTIDKARISQTKSQIPINKQSGSSYRNRLNYWSKKPELSQKKAAASSESLPLIVFYYFSYCHKDKSGNVNNEFSGTFEANLEKEGNVAAKRAARIAAENKPTTDKSDLSVGLSSPSPAMPIAIKAENARLGPENQGDASGLQPVLADEESTRSSHHSDAFLHGATNAKEHSTANADARKTESEQQASAEKINEPAYYELPNDVITKFVDGFSGDRVEEVYSDRVEWTRGFFWSDPEGMVSSVIRNSQYGLRMTDDYRKKARLIPLKSAVISQLHEFQQGNSKSAFAVDNLDGEELRHGLAKLADPSAEFMDLALATVGNTNYLAKLEKLAHDELSFAVFKCLAFHHQGINPDLCAFVFDNISRIEGFCDYTRALAAYLKSVFDTHRGAIDEINSACERAELFLKKHYGQSYYGAKDQALMAKVRTQKTSNLVTTTSLGNLNESRISQIREALSLPVGLVGLTDAHFENPDRIAEFIIENPAEANSIYIPAVIRYTTEILNCINRKLDASDFFVRHMIINRAYAKIEPRTACVVLTPMIALAELSNSNDMAVKLYRWRHGDHPERKVNIARNEIDGASTLGIETAIDLLQSYSFFRNRLKLGALEVENRLEKIRVQLLALESQFQSVKLKTVARYYARFQADIQRSRKTYVLSETFDAPSHALYMGDWQDSFSHN